MTATISKGPKNQGDAMRPTAPIRVRLLAIALVAEILFIPPVSADDPVFRLSTCVEAPTSTVNASRRRAGKSTNCNEDARRAEAIEQARGNAARALAPTCTAQISDQERQDICASRGLVPRPANAAGDMSGFQAIPGSPDGTA